MPIKRTRKSQKELVNTSEDIFLYVAEEETSQYFNLTAINRIYAIQFFNFTTTIYILLLLYLILSHESYLHIGNIWFLPLLLILGLAEYFKFIVTQKLSSIKQNNQDVFYFIPTYICAVITCHFFTILFGAYIIEDIEATFVFSCTLVTLSIVPLYFHYGVNCVWLLCHNKLPTNPVEQSALLISYIAIIGAWFGAFVIPLDWDRSWQTWPIPCSVGTLVGYTIGQIISFFWLFRYNNKLQVL